MKKSDKDLNLLISRKLYEYRMENSYSQERMAEKLNISPRSYWEQEKGKSGFSGRTICRLLCILPPEEVSSLIHSLRTEVWKEDYGMCSRRSFRARFIAHTIDTSFQCCQGC